MMNGVTALFPPECLVCEIFARMLGMEMLRAIRFMLGELEQPDCACGLTIGAHAVAHPHAAALVGCAGIHAAAQGEEA